MEIDSLKEGGREVKEEEEEDKKVNRGKACSRGRMRRKKRQMVRGRFCRGEGRGGRNGGGRWGRKKEKVWGEGERRRNGHVKEDEDKEIK